LLSPITLLAAGIKRLVSLQSAICVDWFFHTIALPHYRTSALSHFRTFTLPHYRTSALSHFRIIALPHFCLCSLSHFSTIALSHDRTFALKHIRIIAVAHYRTSALPHLITLRTEMTAGMRRLVSLGSAISSDLCWL
jgi:hypothetical protein